MISLVAGCQAAAVATPNASGTATTGPLGSAAAISPGSITPSPLPGASTQGSSAAASPALDSPVAAGSPTPLSGAPGSQAPGSIPASPIGSPAASTAIVDSSLLALLPATVAGFEVKEFPEGEQQAADDPNLGRNVARFATAFVVNAEGTNWAYSAVVALRPGAGTDAFFASWQDSFDASACSQAGGVSGHVVVTIGGRSVNETTCLNSVRIYHLRLDQQGMIISISSLGSDRYGEQVIEGLRP